MKLSVNILNWNCIDILRDTICLLKEELSGVDHEVIVVDNGSIDGSQLMILNKMEDYPALKLKAFTENCGISKGKNRGIKESRGDYIMLLDADIFPVRNSIILMMEFLDTHPEADAIGMYPNKWQNQRNTEQIKYHEEYCDILFEPKIHKSACIFYGMFRRKIFDSGIMMDESGEFGKPGYGWEDHDFYKQMHQNNFIQWVAHINKESGRYFHAINSSIRCMGREEYQRTSRERSKHYHEKWN